jgi:hypothetical protein
MQTLCTFFGSNVSKTELPKAEKVLLHKNFIRGKLTTFLRELHAKVKKSTTY